MRVYVNDQPIINQSITFIEIEGKKNAQACIITLKNLLQFHINSPDINNEKAVLLPRDETLGNCLKLTESAQASVRYDVNEQRLDIDASSGMGNEKLPKLC
ncbi:FimD/PapC N-terminal domain-containing protein [Escherichia coli]